MKAEDQITCDRVPQVEEMSEYHVRYWKGDEYRVVYRGVDSVVANHVADSCVKTIDLATRDALADAVARVRKKRLDTVVGVVVKLDDAIAAIEKTE